MNTIDLQVKRRKKREPIYQTGDYFYWKRVEDMPDAEQPPFSIDCEDIYILGELESKKQFNLINIKTGEQWDGSMLFASAQRAGEKAVRAGMERMIPGDTFTVTVEKAFR